MKTRTTEMLPRSLFNSSSTYRIFAGCDFRAARNLGPELRGSAWPKEVQVIGEEADETVHDAQTGEKREDEGDGPEDGECKFVVETVGVREGEHVTASRPTGIAATHVRDTGTVTIAGTECV